MDHVRGPGGSISISLPRDEEGFTGRECPNPGCEGYFKIELGTGLEGEDLPCHCPYCGHSAGHGEFFTGEQIRFIKSVALKTVSEGLLKDLKKLEFDIKPRGAFGIGISMKVKAGRPIQTHRYREQKLETEIVCSSCTLRYAVYGVFAFCPDCGRHNSLQIFDKSLEVVGKMLDLARGAERDVAERLIENALEDCVSAFDGFGRELCRIHASRSRAPSQAERLSFQNLTSARESLVGLFGSDMLEGARPEDWQLAVAGFQKRHLIAHRMGVIDQDYISRSGDLAAVVGRKVSIEVGEVQKLSEVARGLAELFVRNLEAVGANK